MPASPSHQRATLKSVAERAGVAVSTASLVFSGKRHVSEATTKRVLDAAKELGFSGPDPLASSLRQGRSGIVGVYAGGRLLNSFRDQFAVTVLDGLAQQLGSHGVSLLLIPAQGSTQSEIVAHMASIPLDAVVFPLGGNVSDKVLRHLQQRRIPLIGTDYPKGEGITHLHLDERAAMRAIAEHLRGLGHQNAGLLQLPTATDGSVPSNPEALERTQGFLDVFPDAPVVTLESSTISGGATGAAALLDAHPELTAIAAQSDLAAVGTLQTIGARGLSTPGDISVTGFDGIELPWLVGSLTTIDQSGAAKGRTIGDMVIRALAGNATDATHPFRLIAGTSTGAPPSDDDTRLNAQ